MPKFEAWAAREQSEKGAYFSKTALYHVTNIGQVDFVVQLSSIDIKEANKNKKAWGYGFTFINRVDSR